MFSDIPDDTKDFEDDFDDLKNIHEDKVYVPKIENQIHNETLKSKIRDLIINNLIKRNLINESDAENVMIHHTYLYIDDLDECHGAMSTELDNKVLMYYLIVFGKLYATTQKEFISEVNATIDTFSDQLGIEIPNKNNKTR